MLKENRARCAEARRRLEAKLVTDKDHEAKRDRDFMEIREKLHNLIDNESRDSKTSGERERYSLLDYESDMISDIRYQTDVSMGLLLDASQQAHHESLAVIADFAEGKAGPTSSSS